MSFVVLESKERTANESYTIGQELIFNWYKEAGQEKPNRYKAKILSGAGYNQIKVEVLGYVYNHQTENKPLYGAKFPIRIGDVLDIHIGNVSMFFRVNKK